MFWAAGNAASKLAKTLGAPLDEVGRVKVTPDLSLPGHPEVFVVGDLATVPRDGGTFVPGVAQGAIQEGRVAADNVIARLAGRPTQLFTYFNKGDLASIGRHRAIANFGFLQVTGYAAWLMWLFIHVLYLVGFRNRVSVLLQWAYAYFTFQRGMRLITNYARQWDGTVAVGGKYLSADAELAVAKQREAVGSR